MICQKCKREILENSKACPYCGNIVNMESTETEEKMNELLQNNYRYPYGACQKCGLPLEADDNLICKKCKASQESRAQFSNNSYSIKPKKHMSYAAVAMLFIFGSVAAFFGLIIFSANGDTSTSDIYSGENALPVFSPTSSTSSDVIDITNGTDELESKVQSAATAWAIENMEKYGKISDEHFVSGVVKGNFIASFKFRSPNEYGANEQHDLIMQYKNGEGGWKLSTIDFDGQILFDNSKVTS